MGQDVHLSGEWTSNSLRAEARQSGCCERHQTNLTLGNRRLKNLTNTLTHTKSVAKYFCKLDLGNNRKNTLLSHGKLSVIFINHYNLVLSFLDASRESDFSKRRRGCPPEVTSQRWAYSESTRAPHCCDKNNESK